MEMGDQYGLADLRQLMTGRAHFPAFPPPPDQFPGNRSLTTGHHYEMMMLGRQVAEALPPLGALDFRSDSTTTAATTTTTTNNNNTTSNSASTTAAGLCGLEMEGCIGAEGGINGRWPRQETLTLLEIRSGLDSKFKEANQKGPLWDEVSRIMAEQHGYPRSGKKCREKFENLYKYYKKTKEGKSGRQDGKHYRFFRQLEALYGENTNPVLSASEAYVNGVNNSTIRFQSTNNMISTNFSNQETIPVQSQSISISSEFDTSSSEDNDINDLTNDSLMEKKNKLIMTQSLKRGRRSWKAKIREFIDSQMKKLIETQEAWLERMLKTLEQKEQDRMLREEEWRKQEEARIDQEHKFWANERAWFEARDAALMEALKKFTGKELRRTSSSPSEEEVEEETLTKLGENNGNQNEDESEVPDQNTVNINKCLVIRRPNIKECNKKRKENTKTGLYNFQNLESSICNDHQEGSFCAHDHRHHHQASDVTEVSNCNGEGSTGIMNDSCFRFLLSEGENSLWENYCVKLNKEENQ